MKNFLSLQNISLDLDNKEILKGLNLQVDKGEFIAITGSSGAGKTSLLRIICGLESPKEGEILLDNMIIFDKGISVPTEKRNIGLVIQEKVLFPHLTARKNIEFGLSKNSSNESHVDEILHHLNITKLVNKFPHELSGGESQRVALARSIVMKPKLLLLDEPFTGLDTELKSNIYPEIQSILKNNMITSLMVTHDLNEVKALSDKCFNLDSGRLIEI